MLAHLYYELRYSMVLSSNPKAPTLALPYTYIKKGKRGPKWDVLNVDIQVSPWA